MKKILFILLLPITSLFCQEEIDYTVLSETEILKIIDDSLANKDRTIDPIFQTLNPDDKNYKRFEDYVMSKAIDMTEGEDLDYPLYLVESVLYNNLENDAARELYSVIISKQLELKDRIAEEKEKEELKKQEVVEVAKEIETKFDEEVLLESTFNNTKELFQKIEESTKEELSSRNVNHSFIYPLSMNYYKSEAYDDFLKRDEVLHSVRGFCVYMSNEFKRKYLSFRFDLQVNGLYLDGSNEAVNNVLGEVMGSIGFPKAVLPFYLSAGYYQHYYHYDDVDSSVIAITNLPSPFIGLSILDFNLLYIMQFDLGIYGLIAPFYTNGLDSGFMAKAYMTINLVKFSKYSFDLKGGLDYVNLNEGGLVEESIRPKVGLGFSVYD